jgi:hypothetical protein
LIFGHTAEEFDSLTDPAFGFAAVCLDHFACIAGVQREHEAFLADDLDLAVPALASLGDRDLHRTFGNIRERDEVGPAIFSCIHDISPGALVLERRPSRAPAVRACGCDQHERKLELN